jgi:hypothetical protein
MARNAKARGKACRGQGIIAGSAGLHERVKDSNPKLARIAAVRSGQQCRHVGLIDLYPQFGHVRRAQLRRGEGGPLDVFLPGRQDESIDRQAVQE